MNHDQSAGEALLRTGVTVPVRIVEESVIAGTDEAEFALRLSLSFDDEDSPEEDRADVIEWGALGFLFGGRRMKTRVVVRADGTGSLETVGRGKAALR